MNPYDLIEAEDGWYVEMAIDDTMLGPFEDQWQAEQAAVRYLQHH